MKMYNKHKEEAARTARIHFPQIGERVLEQFQLGEHKEKRVGEVVYVHPDRKFYMVEFEGDLGVKIRQCFSPFGRGLEE